MLITKQTASPASTGMKKRGHRKKVFASGLIDFLEKNISPEAIVLFGSVQKGTYHKGSDVDLFVQAEYSTAELEEIQRPDRA